MKKRILYFVLVMIIVLSLAGCSGRSESSKKEIEYTENLMNNAINSGGMPAVVNFFERDMLKNIYELRDDPKLICHWYIKSDLSGKWMYQGMCIGYGIPYSTQMTNPSIADSLYQSDESTYVIDQAEPNGLYSTGSTTATWVLALNSEGKVEPQYLEDAVYVTQTKIERWRCDETALPSDY